MEKDFTTFHYFSDKNVTKVLFFISGLGRKAKIMVLDQQSSIPTVHFSVNFTYNIIIYE